MSISNPPSYGILHLFSTRSPALATRPRLVNFGKLPRLRSSEGEPRAPTASLASPSNDSWDSKKPTDQSDEEEGAPRGRRGSQVGLRDGETAPKTQVLATGSK
ncbi:hypothetical protein RhiXN_11712 [Rhizoctonia solani]|uniref:Uncharacterized protein n=1 Tax=Rhizoctonia solani TaxID=456999 RepID=A0A8H8P451_9AGAM|nr:uncharacterized protein RhiXN_11712 [Rhizoctonia solani]QRW24800.1 hypothetical protein RhiXN_11712 [Rhizoctonia solani]